MQLDLLRMQEMMIMKELHQPYGEIQFMPLSELNFYRETLADINKETSKELNGSIEKAKNMSSRFH